MEKNRVFGSIHTLRELDLQWDELKLGAFTLKRVVKLTEGQIFKGFFQAKGISLR